MTLKPTNQSFGQFYFFLSVKLLKVSRIVQMILDNLAFSTYCATTGCEAICVCECVACVVQKPQIN